MFYRRHLVVGAIRWPHLLAARMLPSQGNNTSSNLVGVTKETIENDHDEHVNRTNGKVRARKPDVHPTFRAPRRLVAVSRAAPP